MNTLKNCRICGQPLSSDIPQGLCPACLMRIGIGTGAGDGPAGDGSGTGPATAFVPPSPEQLQRLIPQFEVLGMIGRGGMGAVYKARQKSLDRFVALKILAKRADDDPKFNERFALEARTLARLSHPNIISVFDFGEAEGLCYLVMEHVDGVNLRQMLQTRKMAPKEALAIVPDLCAALQYAHDRGIVHRDIKPENILIDRQGRIKIADFGIAKLMGTDALIPSFSHPTGAGGAITDAGKIMGTPNYMAPEQTEHPQEVDHRADIFSLGVVFYEMLTGELPNGKFSPPSFKVHIDVRLDEVVLRALEKEPERRYQQASQVQTAVETIASQTAPIPDGKSLKQMTPVSPIPLPEVQAVKTEIRFVILILLVLGLGGLLGNHLANWLWNSVNISSWSPEVGAYLRSFLFYPLHFGEVTGMLALVSIWFIRQCRGYALAQTAIALSWLQPLLWPLTIPSGLTALGVLRRSDVQAAFLAHKSRLMSDAGSRVDVRDAYRLAVAGAVLGLSSFLFLPFFSAEFREIIFRMEIVRPLLEFAKWMPDWSIGMALGGAAMVIMRDLADKAKGLGWATFGVLYPLLFLTMGRLDASIKPQEDWDRLEQLLMKALAAAILSALIGSWGARRLAQSVRTGSEASVRRFMNCWVGMTGVLFLAYVGFMFFPRVIGSDWYASPSRVANDFVFQHDHRQIGTAGIVRRFAAKTDFGTVELLAISEPAATNTCWHPDGTPLCQPASPPPRGTDRRKNTRELLFYFGGADIQVPFYQLRIECFASLAGSPQACPHSGIFGRNTQSALVVNVPTECQAGILRVGLPTKVWEETEASWTWTGDWRRLTKKSIRRQGQDWEIRFQQIKDSPTGLSVAFTHSGKLDWDARLVAVDREGAVRESNRQLDSQTELLGPESVIYNWAVFPDMDASHLKELRFQVRPYHWVEFENISLRTGQNTQIEVKDLGVK